ncbi:hypothetical protein [Alkalihalobacillus sp. BA299]|uniref:hypothetical protein n=1 Tax=Alkalihalobacillus sp. BA299 TaxID=2815938 RepID=UPI001ADAF46F|nr:hypothetical protein [Alkalihalobacillus sp. BA299]
MGAEKVKANFRVTDEGVVHQIKVTEINISELKKIDQFYQINQKKKSKSGSEIEVIARISKGLIENRKNKKVDYAKIMFEKGHLAIELQKTISVKKQKLKRKDNYYIISHELKSALFEVTVNHKVAVNRLYENVILKFEKKMSPQKKVKAKKEPNKPIKAPAAKPSSIEVKIWTAKDTSYRRCEHCHYYNFRQKMCGLFSKRVEANNACKRFYAPRFKTYSGGGFSPR